MNIIGLFSLLAKDGGAIVSSDACSVMEIANAQATGRFASFAGAGRAYVLGDGRGYVLRPKSWLHRHAIRSLTCGEKVYAVLEINGHERQISEVVAREDLALYVAAAAAAGASRGRNGDIDDVIAGCMRELLDNEKSSGECSIREGGFEVHVLTVAADPMLFSVANLRHALIARLQHVLSPDKPVLDLTSSNTVVSFRAPSGGMCAYEEEERSIPQTVTLLPDGKIEVSGQEWIHGDPNGEFTCNAEAIPLEELEDLVNLCEEIIEAEEAAQATQPTAIDVGSISAGALDSAVHEAASSLAAGVNNDGTSGQVEFLRQRGWTDADIAAAALKAGGDQ